MTLLLRKLQKVYNDLRLCSYNWRSNGILFAYSICNTGKDGPVFLSQWERW